MLLHRKKDKRDASSRSLIRYALADGQIGRLRFLAENEFGVHQNAPQRHFDAMIEVAARVMPLLVETHQHLGVLSVTGRRKACRASVATICCAQAGFLGRASPACTRKSCGGSRYRRRLWRCWDRRSDLADVREELEAGQGRRSRWCCA